MLKEIKELRQLKTEATDGATKEEMQVEIMKLVAEVNNTLGTDHVLRGSKMTVLNQY